MRIVPHDYQLSAIRETRGHLISGLQRVLVVAPTGAGKTTIAAEIIQSAIKKHRRVLFIAHRAELIDQASKRLDRYDIDHGIIKAGSDRPKIRALVQVASIQTLVRRKLPPADLIIIDEAHRANSKSYLQVLACYPQAVTLGLTATPWRLDGSGLGDLFQEMVLVCQPRHLIERVPAVLVQPRVFVPSTPDLKRLKVCKGDFEQGALQDLMATEASVEEIVMNWQRHSGDRLTVVFATGIRHSLMIRDAFRAVGVAAEHIDGNTHWQERERILGQLASGRVRVVTNCEVLTEGWDCPQVGCAVLARPTKSLSLYLQMVGRVLRTHPGKLGAIVLDHAGNHAEHGFATDDRAWNLVGGKNERAPSVRTCQACFACVPGSCAQCPECGMSLVTGAGSEGPGKTLVTRELIEVTPGASKELPNLAPHDRWLESFRVVGREATMSEKQALYDALVERCLEQGHRSGSVYHKYKQVMGKAPAAKLRSASPHASALKALKRSELLADFGVQGATRK